MSHCPRCERVETLARGMADLSDREVEAHVTAALFVAALRTDQTPRTVLDTLFAYAPADEEWRGCEEALRDILEVA